MDTAKIKLTAYTQLQKIRGWGLGEWGSIASIVGLVFALGALRKQK